MNHALLPALFSVVIFLGCGEKKSSQYSGYQPPAQTPTQPEAKPTPLPAPPKPTVSKPTVTEPEVAIPGGAKAKAAAPAPKKETTETAPPTPVSNPVPPAPTKVAQAAPTPQPNPVTPTPAQPEPEYAKLAATELEKLAGEGDANAGWILGLRYEAGNGVATNAVAAYQWVAMASARTEGVHRSLILKDQDRIGAMLTAVQIEQASKPAKEFVAKLIETTTEAADKGDAKAQFALGVRLFHGIGVTSDKMTAAEWLGKAAEQGHVGASALLGRMYLTGDTVTKDMVMGYRLLERAANQGSTLAEADLAGAPKTMTPAQLAEASETAAKVLAKKVALLEGAAENGSAEAQFKLGLMFYLGTEIPKDLEGAAAWFENAGKQGHPEAPALLAGMHFSGEGVKQSHVEAYKWHGIAKARGNAAATANQTEVAKLLTTEEKTAANKDVTAWLAANPPKK